MTESSAEGGCLCGGIRFRVIGEPIVKAYCHCRDCRRASGAPVVAFAAYSDDKIEFVRGTPKVYSSSPGVRRSFCGDCGASLSYEADRLHDMVYLYSGLFDEPERFEPEVHGWIEQRISWLHLDDDLPRYEGTSRPS